MNKNWMPDVLRDLKKCAENNEFHLLAQKLDEAHKISQSFWKYSKNGTAGGKLPIKVKKSAQIIDISDQLKRRQDQNEEKQLKP